MTVLMNWWWWEIPSMWEHAPFYELLETLHLQANMYALAGRQQESKYCFFKKEEKKA